MRRRGVGFHQESWRPLYVNWRVIDQKRAACWPVGGLRARASTWKTGFNLADRVNPWRMAGESECSG